MLNHSVHHKTTDIDPIVGSRTPVGLVTTARLSDHIPDLEMLGSHDDAWLSDPDLCKCYCQRFTASFTARTLLTNSIDKKSAVLPPALLIGTGCMQTVPNP